MQDFRELKVWAKSHQLTIAVYKNTVDFPKEERYGLTSQIRRACASIPANIAEGCGRSGNAELLYFLNVAMGSASELQYHLLLARDLCLLKNNAYKELPDALTEVKQKLTSLVKKIKNPRAMSDPPKLPTVNCSLSTNKE